MVTEGGGAQRGLGATGQELTWATAAAQAAPTALTFPRGGRARRRQRDWSARTDSVHSDRPASP